MKSYGDAYRFRYRYVTEVQTDTMLRDIALILGAAFIIIALIYVILRQVEDQRKMPDVWVEDLRNQAREIHKESTPLRNAEISSKSIRAKVSAFGKVGTNAVVKQLNSAFIITDNRMVAEPYNIDLLNIHGFSIAYIDPAFNDSICYVFEFFSKSTVDSLKLDMNYVPFKWGIRTVVGSDTALGWVPVPDVLRNTIDWPPGMQEDILPFVPDSDISRLRKEKVDGA